MGFLIFGKRKRLEASPSSQSPRCNHPISYHVPLHEDPSDPHRITGLKCGQCGQMLEWRRDRNAA